MGEAGRSQPRRTEVRGLGRVRGADGAGSPPATRPGKRFSSQVSTRVPAIGPAQTFLNVVFSVGWNKRLLFIRRTDDNAAGDVQRRHIGSRAMPLTRLRGSQAGLVLGDAVARRTNGRRDLRLMEWRLSGVPRGLRPTEHAPLRWTMARPTPR